MIAALLRSVPFAAALRRSRACRRSADCIPPQVRARLKDLRLTARRARGRAGLRPASQPQPRRRAGVRAIPRLRTRRRTAPDRLEALRALGPLLRARSRARQPARPCGCWSTPPLRWRRKMRRVPAGRGWTPRRRSPRASIELALRQGDRFGLACASATAGCSWSRPAPVRGNAIAACSNCMACRRAARWPDESACGRCGNASAPRDLVVVLSDCFDDGVASIWSNAWPPRGAKCWRCRS